MTPALTVIIAGLYDPAWFLEIEGIAARGRRQMPDENEPLLTPREREFLERHPEALGSPAEEKGFVGVGGWLALLLVTLVLLNPLAILITADSDLSMARSAYPGTAETAGWYNVLVVAWTSGAFAIALSFYAGWRLITQHVPAIVPIVIACYG